MSDSIRDYVYRGWSDRMLRLHDDGMTPPSKTLEERLEQLKAAYPDPVPIWMTEWGYGVKVRRHRPTSRVERMRRANRRRLAASPDRRNHWPNPSAYVSRDGWLQSDDLASLPLRRVAADDRLSTKKRPRRPEGRRGR